MPRKLAFIFFALVLTACSLLNRESQVVPTASSRETEVDLVTLRTVVAATAFAQLTDVAPAGTPSPLPSPTDDPWLEPLQTSAAATVQARQTERVAAPQPTVLPPTSTTAPLLESLKTRIIFQEQQFNGHVTQKITGWENGFLDFLWMDNDHLLFSAVTGPGGEMSWPQNYPVIVNLDSQEIRMPQLGEKAFEGRTRHNREHLPRWSSSLNAFITTETTSSGEAVTLYSKTWDLMATYPGELLSISPSGTKILFENGILIDLISEKQSDWTWNTQQIDEFLSKPNWSEDESRIFTCCYFYNNTKTGENFSSLGFESGNSIYAGGTWMLNDRYFLPDCCLADGFPAMGPGYIPLFDSSTKTFLKVDELAGIPPTLISGSENSCYLWSTAPDKKHVWAECFDGSHLINLATFKAQHFPDLTGSNGDAHWSANSQFALVTKYDNSVQIVSATDGTLQPLPNAAQCDWTPTGNTLLCRSDPIALLDAKTLRIQQTLDFPAGVDNLFWSPDGKLLILSNQGKTLTLLDATTFSTQKQLDLTIQVQNLYWSPDQNSVAVLGQDKSLWRFAYPSLEGLEQLTPAIPDSSLQSSIDRAKFQVSSVTWSPNGKFLAFLYGADIYIVDVSPLP